MGDLSGAYYSIEWGKHQIDILEGYLKNWTQSSPHSFFKELQPDGARYLLVALQKGQLPGMFIAGVGAVINSFRSSLDLIAAECARSNGCKPSTNTHFPFFASFADFNDPKNGIDAKNVRWLNADQRRAIKAARPYPGGNDALWALHNLDIARKHERILKVRFNPIPTADFPDDDTIELVGFRERRQGETELALVNVEIADAERYFTFEVIFDESLFYTTRSVLDDLYVLGQEALDLHDKLRMVTP